MSETRTIDTIHLLRAFGIAMIVLNHAVRFGLQGGLNILFLLSGMSFAALAFRDASPSIWKLSWRFVRRLLIGSVVLCLFWFGVKGEYHPAEILMISNWLGTERVSLFPILYTQVVVQIVLLVSVALCVPAVRHSACRQPLAFSVAALVIAVGVATFSKLTIDTLPLADKLPHLFVWNFALGWIFWAVLMNRKPSDSDRLILSGALIALALLVFPVLQFKGWEARMWIFTLPVLLFIWKPRLALPQWLAHPVLLTSQATLAIFFLHVPLRKLGRAALEGPLAGFPIALSLCAFLISLLGSILIWVALVAFARAWRQTQSTQRVHALWADFAKRMVTAFNPVPSRVGLR